PLSAKDIARGLEETSAPEPEKPEARVIALETGRAASARRVPATPQPTSTPEQEAAHEVFYRDFRASAQDESTPAEVDDPLVRF
ncbi:hypothetical protein, partial [Profundibacterium mesophilum]|uniref:hypothetical protein n=1 Tax=Profundibacterium mesophilum TaxID=1258573 RepID=UPI001356BF79